LETLLATCNDGPIGVRDRALFAWAGGGRRRSLLLGEHLIVGGGLCVMPLALPLAGFGGMEYQRLKLVCRWPIRYAQLEPFYGKAERCFICTASVRSQ
jgi:hypothetical protein